MEKLLARFIPGYIKTSESPWVFNTEDGQRSWLTVSPAVEPEILYWENFGVSKVSKAFRYIQYILFVFLILVLCFYILSLLESEN